MILTNPRKPVLTGIIFTLIISTLVIGGVYLYPYLFRVINNIDLVEEVQLPESVKNSFGTYELPELIYTPSIIPTPIQANLANVNLQGLGDELNSEIINQLETYGFALIDDGTEDIFYPVDYDFNLETPMYISTDLCLHVLHSIFDNCLRIIEMEYFYGNFSSMINTLREDQMDLYTVIVEPELKEALQYNVAYLIVLMHLLDDTTSIPSYVNTIVSGELDNLEKGVEDYSAIFGYLEDYTQYKPRGHYTRSDAFKRYFRTMMYAGRMGFVLDDQSASNPIGVKQTRMALALVYSFNEEIGDKVVWDYWDKICRTTDFLVGGSDDLTPVEYFSVWEEEGVLNFSDLSSDSFILEMIDALKELRAPKINSRYVGVFEGEESATKAFKLFGQGYTPDAYIFQELVFDNVLDRYFPKPLDILSVFGSERAEYHLESEKSYPGYEDKIQALREEFGNLTVANWTQNIYWQWLYSILPLLDEKGDGYPGYMLSDVWSDKSLMTALASWVELKHDTVLYAKQPMGVSGIGDKIVHYVEPYPKVYSRISATLSMLKEGLDSRDVLYENQSCSPDDFDQRLGNLTVKFDELIEIFDKLTELSIKELENEKLTDEDLNFLHHVGKDFQILAIFDYGVTDYSSLEADKRTALVVDVFTEPYSHQVLEVAVGNPFLIYVIVQDHTGDLYLTRGVTFSYYEFNQPYDQRLTDEEWQEMLDISPPELPEWISTNLHIIEVEAVVMHKVQTLSNGVNKGRTEEKISSALYHSNVNIYMEE